jgi:hypothetical protein
MLAQRERYKAPCIKNVQVRAGEPIQISAGYGGQFLFVGRHRPSRSEGASSKIDVSFVLDGGLHSGSCHSAFIIRWKCIVQADV